MSDLVSEIRQRIAVSMAAADNKNYCIVWTIKEANATADRIEELETQLAAKDAVVGRCERRAEADMNTIRALRKENEKLVDECCQLKEGYTSIRVQFATFTKTVGGAFANAFKEGFMEGWMDGKHGTSPDPSPVVDAAWEKSKHINFINMVDCGGGDE